MAEHNELGKWGEEVAREHLLKQGYAIGGENIRVAGVEIDFIATRDDTICFVEVKTRATDFTDPIEAVDSRKRRRHGPRGRRLHAGLRRPPRTTVRYSAGHRQSAQLHSRTHPRRLPSYPQQPINQGAHKENKGHTKTKGTRETDIFQSIGLISQMMKKYLSLLFLLSLCA